MKKSALLILSIVMIGLYSCKKKDTLPDVNNPTSTSFTMTYDGVTYTKYDIQSMNVASGIIAIVGAEDEEFWLNINGIPNDGETVDICLDQNACSHVCTLLLDFGASIGKPGFVAESGTVSRNGHNIQVNVAGHDTNLDPQTLTANFTVASIIF